MTSLTNAKTVEEIVVVVEKEFQDMDVSTDIKSLPTLACDLCDVLKGELTSNQIKVLSAARHFLEKGAKESADAYVTELARRVGKPYPSEITRVAIAKERLLWIALNRNAPLSGYGVEFTLGFAEEAGLRPVDMIPSVRKMLAIASVMGGQV